MFSMPGTGSTQFPSMPASEEQAISTAAAATPLATARSLVSVIILISTLYGVIAADLEPVFVLAWVK